MSARARIERRARIARTWGSTSMLALSAIACSREVTPPTATSATSSAWFRDITAESGCDFVHVAGVTPEKHLPETMGAGAALVDVDEDGDLDLYCVQGGPLPTPEALRDPLRARPTNRLYLNDGRARFADATAASGAAADAHYGMGVAAGDADGDGHVDLYLANLGPDALLRGDGLAHFTDVSRASGIVEDEWTTGAAFFDADADGDLDLFVTTYVAVDLARPDWCGERKPGWRSYCHPDRYAGLPDRYWRNRGDGTFEDRTAAAGFVGDENGKGLCVLASDLDGDADVDLFIANDSTENRLWRNRGDGTFEDATLESGTGLDRYGRTEASMGVASGDVDLDGDLDLFVTGFDDESDTLYVNAGGAVFEDATVQRGLELETRLPVGFGAVLADFDGDGDLDLAIANGHIIDNIALYHDAKTHAQRALLYENTGAGRFTNASARGGALTDRAFVGRGLYAGDLDGDGDPDLVLTQCNGPLVVLANERTGGRSVSIEGLPVAARVVLTTSAGRNFVREAGPAPSYLGQCDPRVAIACGSGEPASLTITLPGGTPTKFSIDRQPHSAHHRFHWKDGALVPAR